MNTYNYKQNIPLFFLYTFIIGLFFSNAILSISTILLFLAVIIFNRQTIKINTKNFLQIGLLLLFSVYVIWAFYKTTSIVKSIDIIVAKLSLLGLALTIPNFILSKKSLNYIFYFILVIVIGISSYNIILYFSDFNFWQAAYSKGQVLPTFIHHVKFSFIVVCCILYLYVYNFNKKTIHYILIAYLIIYLHLLSVKSGLVLLYLLFILLFIIKIIEKKYIYLLLITIPFLLYQLSPSLKSKISYFSYDLKQLKSNNVLDYSDARRIISYRAALYIFNHYKFFGTGLTQLKPETKAYYISKYKKYDAEKMLYVHNSYLHILASCGFIGLILWLTAVLLIQVYYLIERNFALFIINSLFFLICFWDAFTEQLTGISLFIIIQILGNSSNLAKNKN